MAERGIACYVARLPRIFGPTLLPSDTKALSQFILKAVAGEDIVLNASKSLSSYSDENISFMAGEDVSVSAKNITTTASENSKHNADTLSLLTETEIEMTSKKVGIDSSKENLVLSTGGDVETKAKGKVNLF
jgi:uncharacterized protein (DUF2345 family)